MVAPRAEIPAVLPGHVQLAKTIMIMPLFYEDVPELIRPVRGRLREGLGAREELSKA